DQDRAVRSYQKGLAAQKLQASLHVAQELRIVLVWPTVEIWARAQPWQLQIVQPGAPDLDAAAEECACRHRLAGLQALDQLRL
ncbi:hypothetical protein DC357_23150, partial [Vibrio vulnificus]